MMKNNLRALVLLLTISVPLQGMVWFGDDQLQTSSKPVRIGCRAVNMVYAAVMVTCAVLLLHRDAETFGPLDRDKTFEHSNYKITDGKDQTIHVPAYTDYWQVPVMVGGATLFAYHVIAEIIMCVSSKKQTPAKG